MKKRICDHSRCSKTGHWRRADLVFVLGHPEYYPRYGFRPATVVGFEAPYPIPEKVTDAWMVQALTENVISTVAGKVICSDELSKPELWRE